ncbi:MAG: AI-2E family transporter, partial [Balneolales bacterium]|nr:AI-2E family transporter [Balneolales bacterium]
MRNITLEKVVRFGVGLIAVGVVGLIMYNYSTLVAYLILAMILSYILDPFVNRLQRMGLNRTLGITLTLSGMILLLVFISTNIIPLVVEEMLKLSDFLTIERIESIAIDLEIWLTTNYTFIPEGYIESSISQIAETLFNMDRITNVLNDALGLFTNIFSAILVVPFAAFFFIKDGSKIRRDVLTLI